MVGTSGAIRVATKPVDFRMARWGLAALVRENMRTDPFLCVERDYVAEALNAGRGRPRLDSSAT